VANKIGTYSVAVLAHVHGIPFYVAAPVSTLDLSLVSGDLIPIEERSSAEVTHLAGISIAPRECRGAPPSLRRHAAPLRHGHRHRARHRAPTVHGEFENAGGLGARGVPRADRARTEISGVSSASAFA
jgi:translation initiation factor 2B subunit (eIF-2B alpha/beta/delta family)